MTEHTCPYGENTYMLKSATNLLISELQNLTPKKFDAWAVKFRKEVVHAWDEQGVPVLGGKDEDDIVRQFRALANYDVSTFLRSDELTNKQDCIVNETAIGSACNQFFPTMLKTKDISTNKLSGASIYSYFKEDRLLDRFISTLHNMVDNDPFAYFSDRVPARHLSARDWVLNFEPKADKSIWVAAMKKPRDGDLHLTHAETKLLVDEGCLQASQVKGEGKLYCIRIFDPNKRIMDVARMFRLSFGGTPATNFPPLTAKYLYLRFTEEIKDQEQIVVYDPSAGWGGRILGAMACCNERNIHYVGTDPNSDHWMDELGMTKYAYLADYFNGNVHANNKNTYEIFREGSEVIRDNPEFDLYRGKIDFIFTSPPYFAAEGYSDEDTQSHMKFPTYESWRDGFLTQTLETCVDWLREGRWLCINIADVRFDNTVLPLQQDTIDILLNLGLGYHGMLKMVLRDAPTATKETDVGIPTTRNFCQLNGKQRKFEPVLMFKKFIAHDGYKDDFEWVDGELVEL